MTTLTLTVNGDPRVITGPATLADLLRQLDLDARMVVVELNREIVRRPRLAEIEVQNGDSVELVHFVGGG
ncbi:MAG TPA: sulfur carrier protein ThiS [Gemmatimonadales bacterium]|jgi:thiazole synthase